MEHQNIKKTETRTWNIPPYIKAGATAGLIGFFIGGISGQEFCPGLVISIIIGGIAGTLAGRYEKVSTREGASRFGASSGGIAGIFILLGQMFGGIIPLLMIRTVNVLGFFPANSFNALADVFSVSYSPNFFNFAFVLITTSVAGSIAAIKSFE